MSRLGRSQPVQPAAWHGFVDPGPGPVGTTPARPVVVENDDRQRRRFAALPPVVLSGVYAVSVQPTVLPPGAVVSSPFARSRTLVAETVSQHGLVDDPRPFALVIEQEERQRKTLPLQPVIVNGLYAIVTAPVVTPPPPTVAIQPDRPRVALVQPVIEFGLIDSGVGVPGTTPPPPLNIDRADQRVRYKPLDSIAISAAFDALISAPAPTPPGPFVVPLDERRRFLAAIPATTQHGYDDSKAPSPYVVEPERRRYQPLDPISLSAALDSVIAVAPTTTLPSRALIGVGI